MLESCIGDALGLGFEQATKSCISRKLSYIQPNGGTRMRDSIMMGTSLMYQFRAIVEERGMGQVWKFVHLVITDGADEGSSTTLEDLGVQICQLQRRLPAGFLKTIYIGVDIENNRQALAELALLRLLGEDSADIFNVHDDQIDNTFEKIKISLGIRRTTQGLFMSTNQGTVGIVRQQQQAVIQAERQRYMVLFNIDRSGSMQGIKWRNLCGAVDSFLNQLRDDDLVCGLVFNSDVEVLTFLNLNTRQAYQPLYTQQSQQPQVSSVSKRGCWARTPTCLKWILCIVVIIVIVAIVVGIAKK